tara:strand:+ start:174 stop:1529 length:1356 start_codon:yes stop_codon:yes gene_type:complete
MSIITDQKIVINKNFEQAINEVKSPTGDKASIPYRDWMEERKQVEVFKVPIEYCRYRLENGRISIETSSYSVTTKPLKQDSPEDQEKIAEYLNDDKKNNEILKTLLRKDGQTAVAVITADGYLINGNRRKLILGQLFNEKKEEKFKYIKVVILPGSEDPESPTIRDIAMLEYRYQVQSDGKSDYSDMAKALTTRNNMLKGLELEQMLRDDPQYSNLPDKAFKNDLKKFERDTIGTLKVVDEYLIQNKIKGNYKMIQTRWDSFKELNQRVFSRVEDDGYLDKYDIQEDEIGEFKEAAFNIMKLKNPKIINKSRHSDFVRQINTWVKNSKDDFLKISEVGDVSDDITDPQERETEWEHTKSEEVENLVKKVHALTNKKIEQEGPINKLQDILRMLDHKYLEEDKISRMPIDELDTAIKLTNSIQTANKELQKTFYDLKDNKSPKALKKHFENR